MAKNSENKGNVNGTKPEEGTGTNPEVPEVKEGFFRKIGKHFPKTKDDWKNIGKGVLKVGSYAVVAAGGFVAGSMLSGRSDSDPEDIGYDSPDDREEFYETEETTEA